MKQQLALATLFWAAFPVLADNAEKKPVNNDALTLYGRANVSLQNNDEGEGSYTDMVSHTSVLGVKGQADLSDQLEVFYQIEFGVDLADFDEGDDTLSNRNQVIGLRGSFGELILGRRDTFTKMSQGNVDKFLHYEADLKNLFRGENRLDNTVTYYSPSFKQFKLGGTFVVSEDESSDDGVSFGIIYGDKALNKTRFYAALAVDRDIADYDIEQVTFVTKWGGTEVGAAVQQFERTDGLFKSDGYLLSAAHPFNNWVFKAQYQALNYEDDKDASVSLGVDYVFNADSRVYAWYATRKCDIQRYESRGCVGSQGREQNYLAVGIRHQFCW